MEGVRGRRSVGELNEPVEEDGQMGEAVGGDRGGEVGEDVGEDDNGKDDEDDSMDGLELGEDGRKSRLGHRSNLGGWRWRLGTHAEMQHGGGL